MTIVCMEGRFTDPRRVKPNQISMLPVAAAAAAAVCPALLSRRERPAACGAASPPPPPLHSYPTYVAPLHAPRHPAAPTATTRVAGVYAAPGSSLAAATLAAVPDLALPERWYRPPWWARNGHVSTCVMMDHDEHPTITSIDVLLNGERIQDSSFQEVPH